MIEARYKGARSMGDFVGYTPQGAYVATERHCAACGCKLRIGNHTAYCAPCTERIHPWTPPELRSGKNYDKCACGTTKSITSTTCVDCYRERQRIRRRVPVDRRLKARTDGLCANCGKAPHRPRHSLCVKCSNQRYRKSA